MIPDLPLYPNEKQIAVAVMGDRAEEWPTKARYLESKHGLPPVDELMGGRFWPAVVEFFNIRHGVGPGSLALRPRTEYALFRFRRTARRISVQHRVGGGAAAKPIVHRYLPV